MTGELLAFLGLPQFAPSSGPAFLVLLGLGLLFCAMTFAWLVLYAATVDRLSSLLARPLGGRPPERRLHPLRQARHHQVVGVLDHVEHEAIRDRAVDLDGVPVALV